MNIVESVAAGEFFRRPRSKRRRIINKWRKRRENYRPAVFYSADCGGQFFVHPALMPQVRHIAREVAREAQPFNTDGGIDLAALDMFPSFGKSEWRKLGYVDVNYKSS